MKLWRKLLVLAVPFAVGIVACGCSGVNASGSVSPATFFLPGIMSRTPELKAPEAVREPELADSRPLGGILEVGQP